MDERAQRFVDELTEVHAGLGEWAEEHIRKGWSVKGLKDRLREAMERAGR